MEQIWSVTQEESLKYAHIKQNVVFSRKISTKQTKILIKQNGDLKGKGYVCVL